LLTVNTRDTLFSRFVSSELDAGKTKINCVPVDNKIELAIDWPSCQNNSGLPYPVTYANPRYSEPYFGRV
jgi:hypothetical protein